VVGIASLFDEKRNLLSIVAKCWERGRGMFQQKITRTQAGEPGRRGEGKIRLSLGGNKNSNHLPRLSVEKIFIGKEELVGRH